MKLLINKTNGALESKTNTALLENELAELQKRMDKTRETNQKLKNHTQKLKMER